MTRLGPRQRIILLAVVFAGTFAAIVVASLIDQKMVAETLSWCSLLVITTLTYVILDARPGWMLGGASIAAAAVATLAPFSVLSHHISPEFAYANINTFAPIGLYGLLALLGIGMLTLLQAVRNRRSQGN